MPLKGKSRSKRACRKHKRQVRDDSIPVDEAKNELVRVVATTSVNNNSNLGNNDLSHYWSKRWTLNISFPTLAESSEQLGRPSVSSTGLSGISFSENRNCYRACTCSSSLPIAGFDYSTFNAVESATYCPRINLKVLPKIFQLLNLKDLKSCRIVNSAWNKIASDELGTRHDYPVSFGFCLDQKCYYSKFLSDDAEQICTDFEIHGWNSDSNCLNKILSTKVTLRDLCNCLHLTSLKTNFPWTYFEFTDGIIDRCTDAREFFSMYGSRIRKLSVNFSRVTLPNLHKLFFFMAPKVEYLKLEKLVCIGNAAQAEAYHHQSQSCQQSPACHRLSHFSHSLPMLKILELGSDGRMIAVDWILRAVVMAANNLEEIKNASLDHLDVIVQSNKVHCVKSFCVHLNLSLFKYEWILQKFVNFHLNLHRLVITVDQKWRGERQAYTSAGDSLIPMIFPKVINKILRSCPETLEALTLMPLGNFSALEYPVLGKVKKLTLQAYNFVKKCDKEHWRNQMYFPEWLDFTKRFPNLRQLTVSLITWELNFNQDYGKLSCLPSVQRLSIINYFDSNSKIIPIFAQLFPNVKQLTMKFDFLKLNLQSLDLIWKSWPKLEELNFEFVGTTQSLYVSGGSPLDLIFTGLDKRSYELLKRDPFGEFTRDQIVRTYPSISNMTYLRSLSMKFSRYFDDEDGYLRDSGSNLITLPLSIVSVLYDFKWLPHLSLRMTFDEYPDECRGLVHALKTLAPYMAIEFNTDFVRDIEISPTHCSFCEVAEANHQWFEAHGYD